MLISIGMSLLVAFGGTLDSATAPLRVVRTTPIGEGPPNAVISVMFDRPVAGSLDQSVDPATVMTIAPAIPGRFEWRDPVTLRFIPSAPIVADTRVTVTVNTSFAAMDGSRLAAPHQFTFRVLGPKLLAASPATLGATAFNVDRNQRFDLVFSESVDHAQLAAATMIAMNTACGPASIAVRVESQRPIGKDDDYTISQAGGWQRDRSRDSLRRVVRLAPRAALPFHCGGAVVVPNELAAGSTAGVARLQFRTYGPLALAGVSCGWQASECPTGPFRVTFSTPVRGATVQRHVRSTPAVALTVSDTTRVATEWTLQGMFRPRTRYDFTLDTAFRDIFGQHPTAATSFAGRTTGHSPSATYPTGRQVVERVGRRTFPVVHVNVDTLVVEMAPLPDSLIHTFLSRGAWGLGDLWPKVQGQAVVRRYPVRAGQDRGSFTGIPLPFGDTTTSGTSALLALRVRGKANEASTRGQQSSAPGIAIVQVTDLGVTVRLGADEGSIWVTGVSDGLPRSGALVELRGTEGRLLGQGRSDASGLVRLNNFPSSPVSAAVDSDDEGQSYDSAEGYVTVSLGTDRAVVPVNRYDPDLSPWNFGVRDAYGPSRVAVAGAVFTERGIYRPGEEVFAKSVLREGPLGSLRTPQPSDSVRWLWLDREGETVKRETVALSAFGTSEQRFGVPANAAIGEYTVAVAMRRQGSWLTIASARFRVAEYRPPEFLVDLLRQDVEQAPDTQVNVLARGRYLFGAPMARALLSWEARLEAVPAYRLGIPGTDGWVVGKQEWSWEDYYEDYDSPSSSLVASGTDTLDARGETVVRVDVPKVTDGGARRAVLATAVTDVNRQVVGSSTSTLIHPADFYLAVRSTGESWFWRAGEAQRIAVRAVQPDGAPAGEVEVRGTLVRREWHRVSRERYGTVQMVGEWVSDTVARCTARTTVTEPPMCELTPAGGGLHIVAFEATDASGDRARTSMNRWVAGSGFVPWGDESQFKMDVLADRERYSVGDTATILLAAPFTGAEAWVTVERERVLESFRLRIVDGATTIKVPITEAFAPNAFVSVVLVRGRSAPISTADDPGRPTMRVGYTELRVTPEIKRLQVEVSPTAAEFRPADSARVRIRVRDVAGRGARSEVAIWAVDEGVLALTGYKTPNLIDLLYAPRALGLRLASNLVAVTPQVPEGEKGRREPGGGGGASGAEVLRSRFKTTAFYLGSVVTDEQGQATVSALLPDNLTTFRVMAVAVTAGDRYGSGESPLLVTRPVVARAALPRFVRPGDDLLAGATVNRRDGAAGSARVATTATGIARQGAASRTVRLQPGQGAEARFRFLARDGDSAAFTFTARSGRFADAVRVAIPIKPDYQIRSHTLAGAVVDTTTLQFDLPEGIDPARSRLFISIGPSPLAVMRGASRAARVYPYDCTEQITSSATVVIAMLKLQGALSPQAQATARADLARGVQSLLRRQRTDGGIGYWAPTDWTTPWLSAEAGRVLLDARELGVPVDSAALDRLAEYLRAMMRGQRTIGPSPLGYWYGYRQMVLADQVASADFLSRLGRPDVAIENGLIRMTAQLAREDRIRLATIVHRRGAVSEARQLLEPIWQATRVDGRRAVLAPDSARHYFRSSVRETARLLIATLALEPNHQLVGPLVETLASQERVSAAQWNTQDRAHAIRALGAFEDYRRSVPPREVAVRGGNRVLVRGSTHTDTTIALVGLLGDRDDETRPLRLQVSAVGDGGAATFFYLTVNEVPLVPPVRPSESGIIVERWYERHSDGTPVTSVVEGELVRVRLRITVPAERHFVVVDDALPAGLEAVDLSLRTSTMLAGLGGPPEAVGARGENETDERSAWGYGRWDSGWWSPWDHTEIRDDRVVYSATVLWRGTHSITYVARATSAGTFVRPPAHAEEMYNPGVNGRTEGGKFTVTPR